LIGSSTRPGSVETTIFETSFAARIQCNEGARFGGFSRSKTSVGELDRLDPQLIRQHRLVLPNLADHRLGCVRSRKNSTTFSVWALTTP
jgi:hypothetical protein